ncbi:MAG: PH domain-containing protein [Candidatus Wenzhouxiangella sp. M2_3B_020]
MAGTTDAWKALPAPAVAALYVNGVQKFVRENLIAFFGAGTGFAISDSLGWRELGLGIALLLLIGLLITVIYHRRFRYSLDGEAVRVRKGLFEQQEIKVRLERVQNIGFSQPLYLRPMGLIRVSLETPGAAHTEVELPGIPLQEAKELRDLVAATRHDEARGEETQGKKDADATVAFEAGASDLFKYGLTSNQIWILLALVGAPASNLIERRISGWIEQAEAAGLIEMETLAGAPMMVALAVLVILIAFALLVMMISGLIAIARFHGFRLRREGDRFIAAYGLFEEREKTLRSEKLHSIELVQSAIGRALGQWHAIGHQTGAQQISGQAGEERRFMVPGIDGGRLDWIAELLRGTRWTRPRWRSIDARYRTILAARITVPLLCIGVMTWWTIPWLALPVVGVNALLVVAVCLRYRRWAWEIDGDRLRIRSGTIGQTVIDFETSRCQQISISSSPYQRRHGLASLSFRLPHGDQSLPYVPLETAHRLVNLVLFRVESSRDHAL